MAMNRFLIKVFGFVVFPFLVLEIAFRVAVWVKPAHLWYKGAEAKAKMEKIDFLFIGTSRVGAAIDENVFSEQMATGRTRKGLTLNMGYGYSTMQIHYLALLELQQTNPENFKGCTVFIEAPFGLPDAVTWPENWVTEKSPLLIVNYLKARDIIMFWRVSKNPWETKTYVTLAWGSKAIYGIAQLRSLGLAIGEAIIKSLVDKIMRQTFSIPSQADSLKIDLSSKAGIRTDAAAVDQVRQLAITAAQAAMKNQQPVDNWEQTVLWDVIRFVRANGGNVVFYSMPLSTIQEQPLNTPLRQADKKAFITKAAACQVPYLTVPFDKTDDDFPDLWHLRKSQSPKFTTALAYAYLASIGTDSLHQVPIPR